MLPIQEAKQLLKEYQNLNITWDNERVCNLIQSLLFKIKQKQEEADTAWDKLNTERLSQDFSKR